MKGEDLPELQTLRQTQIERHFIALIQKFQSKSNIRNTNHTSSDIHFSVDMKFLTEFSQSRYVDK